MQPIATLARDHRIFTYFSFLIFLRSNIFIAIIVIAAASCSCSCCCCSCCLLCFSCFFFLAVFQLALHFRRLQNCQKSEQSEPFASTRRTPFVMPFLFSRKPSPLLPLPHPRLCHFLCLCEFNAPIKLRLLEVEPLAKIASDRIGSGSCGAHSARPACPLPAASAIVSMQIRFRLVQALSAAFV